MKGYEFELLCTPADIQKLKWDLQAVRDVCDQYASEICSHTLEEIKADPEVQLDVVGRMHSLRLIQRCLRYRELPDSAKMAEYIETRYLEIDAYTRPALGGGVYGPLYRIMREQGCSVRKAREIMRATRKRLLDAQHQNDQNEKQ